MSSSLAAVAIEGQSHIHMALTFWGGGGGFVIITISSFRLQRKGKSISSKNISNVFLKIRSSPKGIPGPRDLLYSVSMYRPN